MLRLLPILLLLPITCKSIDLQDYIPTKVRVKNGAESSKRINNAEYAGQLRGTYFGLRFENAELASAAKNLAATGSWKIYFKGKLVGYEDIVDSEDGSTLRIYSDAKEEMFSVVVTNGELGFYQCELDRITKAPADLVATETKPESKPETAPKQEDKTVKAPPLATNPVAEDMDAIVAAFNAYSSAAAYSRMVENWQCGKATAEKHHNLLIASLFLENLSKPLGIHPVVKARFR